MVAYSPGRVLDSFNFIPGWTLRFAHPGDRNYRMGLVLSEPYGCGDPGRYLEGRRHTFDNRWDGLPSIFVITLNAVINQCHLVIQQISIRMND